MSDSSPFKYNKADESAGFVLWKISTLWQAKLRQVLSEFGITQTQYAILASLKWFEERKEPTTQSHLVQHTKIDKMTISKAIRRLQKDGFVSRENSTTDNRAMDVRFTAKGSEVIHKAIVAIENADEDFFHCLSEKQLIGYKSLTLEVIASNSSQV